MIAWCGTRSDGLGWLCDRSGWIDELDFVESLSVEAVNAICSQYPRRLILSVENRCSYPLTEIQHLQQAWPEIPFALAFGSWFDGSRRTGIGSTSQLSLPWYRWWDGWCQWLTGSNTELLNPWPQAMDIRLRRSGVDAARSTGIILSNCQQTAAGWQAAVAGDPSSTAILKLSEFRPLLAQATLIAPDWILWDDSCLDTFAGTDCLTEVCDLFTMIRARFPGVVILAATCMPRWSDWQQWMGAGANELIAKPSQGFSSSLFGSMVELRDKTKL